MHPSFLRKANSDAAMITRNRQYRRDIRCYNKLLDIDKFVNFVPEFDIGHNSRVWLRVPPRLK